MKLKLGPKEIQLCRVARVNRVRGTTAKITMCTGEAILVKCAVHYPDGCTFTYPGTFEELKAFIDKYRSNVSAVND